jgi:rRNA processing protein Gar1
MKDFLFSHLGSIGLVLDIVGATILFFVVVKIEEQITRVDRIEDESRARKKKNKENILRLGYGLILLGFVLQLISNELNILQ